MREIQRAPYADADDDDDAAAAAPPAWTHLRGGVVGWRKEIWEERGTETDDERGRGRSGQKGGERGRGQGKRTGGVTMDMDERASERERTGGWGEICDRKEESEIEAQ